MNDETSAPQAGARQGWSGRLIYLLPLITALGAGIWAVVTWLFPHPIPDKAARQDAPVARAQTPAPPPPAGAITASGGSMVVTGPVSGSIRNGGEANGDRRR